MTRQHALGATFVLNVTRSRSEDSEIDRWDLISFFKRNVRRHTLKACVDSIAVDGIASGFTVKEQLLSAVLREVKTKHHKACVRSMLTLHLM